MKKMTLTAVPLLLISFLLLGTSAFAVPFNMINGGSDDVSNLSVDVTDIGGGAQITVQITGPVIGDILGIFGSVTQDVGTGVISSIVGADITHVVIGENVVSDLGGGNNMNGTSCAPFDFGVTIGSQGIGGGDDFQMTSINVLGVTAADFTKIGVRIQSVGTIGLERSGSAKYCGSPVPEPATMLLFGAGLAGLGMFRKKLAKV